MTNRACQRILQEFVYNNIRPFFKNLPIAATFQTKTNNLLMFLNFRFHQFFYYITKKQSWIESHHKLCFLNCSGKCRIYSHIFCKTEFGLIAVVAYWPLHKKQRVNCKQIDSLSEGVSKKCIRPKISEKLLSKTQYVFLNRLKKCNRVRELP